MGKNASEPRAGEACSCIPIVVVVDTAPIEAKFLKKPKIPCVISRNLVDEEKAFGLIFVDWEITYVMG